MPIALYMLALSVFVMGTSEFMLAGLLPAIASDLGVTVGSAGTLTSAFAVGMVVGAPTMAAFARRFPPRLTLIVCLAVFASCHIVGAITTTFSILLATRFISAFANAGFLAVALSTAITLVPENRKGRALSILLAGTTTATIAGVPAGALLGNALGWRATFWGIGVLSIPAAVGIFRGVRSRPAETATNSSAAPDLATELCQLRSRHLLLAMTLGALVNGGTFAAFTFLALLVTDSAGLADDWIPIALVVFGAGSFFGVTLAGRLSDQRPGLLLAAGGPLLLAGWVTLALYGSQPVLLIPLVFLQGLLAFGVGSTLITRVLYAAADAPTMGGSYATASLNIGAAAGPVLGGLGLTTDVGTTAPVWVAATLTGITLVVMLLSRRTLTETRTAGQRGDTPAPSR
ncbi:Cmx/CmrA family chloramphenicol efflux MFS transporter [Mycolicibacterium litorale]|uniref:Cmx/CmrA family chloramphenicol efflux MFS transporter n=1 Tax=Mycolicibacterium litorale TaxID=758802 RepID=UPI003CEA67F5